MALNPIKAWLSATDPKWSLNEHLFASHSQMRAKSLIEALDVTKRHTRQFGHYSIGSMSYEPLTITPLQLILIYIDSLFSAHKPSWERSISCLSFKSVNKHQSELNIEKI